MCWAILAFTNFESFDCFFERCVHPYTVQARVLRRGRELGGRWREAPCAVYWLPPDLSSVEEPYHNRCCSNIRFTKFVIDGSLILRSYPACRNVRQVRTEARPVFNRFFPDNGVGLVNTEHRSSERSIHGRKRESSKNAFFELQQRNTFAVAKRNEAMLENRLHPWTESTLFTVLGSDVR